MFEEWCQIEEKYHGNKKALFHLTEKNNGRAAIEVELIDRVRSHYDDLQQIADDVRQLGYPGAAAILGERLPRTKRARSGEMGEILATEFIGAQTEFRVPVRRLRYKDGREMALRGDDFIGVGEDEQERLCLLKGESKSRRALTPAVISEARQRLSSDDGRPTPISMLFTADRLLQSRNKDEELGRKIRNEVALRAVPSGRITHALFTLSENNSGDELEKDLAAADDSHRHVSAGMQVEDHREFISEIYNLAAYLGDD